jgi:hypothetical protein
MSNDPHDNEMTDREMLTRTRHERIITPDTDPDRFTAEEETYFRDGKCAMTTGYGLPWMEHCGQPSRPGASFGNCPEHDDELLEQFYPDGTRRPAPVLTREQVDEAYAWADHMMGPDGIFRQPGEDKT